MQHYVLAFVFDEREEHLLLIYKDRPTFLADKWNGIGGHVEAGESVGVATCRELHEEADLVVSPTELRGFAMLMGADHKLYCSAVKLSDDRFAQHRTKTSEQVSKHEYKRVIEDMVANPAQYGPDLSYLVPMAKLALGDAELSAAVRR